MAQGPGAMPCNTHKGKERGEDRASSQLSHSAAQQKLTQHGKSAMLQIFN